MNTQNYDARKDKLIDNPISKTYLYQKGPENIAITIYNKLSTNFQQNNDINTY